MASDAAPDHPTAGGSEGAFFTGLARAFGGAIIFSLPLLMTMEMWWLGFYMGHLRLVLLLALMLPVLVGLSHFGGFKSTATWTDDAVDAVVACGVGFVASASVLLLLGVLGPGMPLREIAGKVLLQTVPASFGAMLGRSQLGGRQEEETRKSRSGYASELFLMMAGALFLAFNVAPTQEMVMIAYRVTPWHALALLVISLALMHAFVYAAEFKGGADLPEGTPWWSEFLRLTVVGYVIALAVSAYVLWTFGRFESGAFETYLRMILVLGFPASIGAAAARLLI